MCLMTSLKVSRMAVSGAILSTLVPLPLKYARSVPVRGASRQGRRTLGGCGVCLAREQRLLHRFLLHTHTLEAHKTPQALALLSSLVPNHSKA